MLHVTALSREPAGRLRTLRIGPAMPKSETDDFALQLARARSDVILTTGANLRAEPGLETWAPHVLAQSGLDRWRSERLGRREPPLLAVLTSGRSLDLDHRALSGRDRVLVLTTSEGAHLLAPHASAHGIDVIVREEVGVRDAIACLRDERGLANVVVEAGPSTSRWLYHDPCLVDELMLTLLDGAAAPGQLEAAPFETLAELRALYDEAAPPCVVRESGGRWSFQRFLRRGAQLQ